MSRSSRLTLLPGLLLGASLGFGCGEPLNYPPTGLEGPRAGATVARSGQTVQLTALASDPEGDPITYAWKQELPASPHGTFSDSAAPSPTWTAPQVSEDTRYLLQILIRDDHDNALVGTVSIIVKPPPAPQREPGAEQ